MKLVTTEVDGENVEYCFEYSPDGVNWQTIGSGWSSARSISWTPNVCGACYLRSAAQQSGGATPQSVSASISYLITAPLITAFTPSSGGAGTVVSITGTNFTGATAVSFGGTAAASFTVGSDTTISATVGEGATGIITVTIPSGIATSGNPFSYTGASTITSFTPSSGVAGTMVTISGENFTGATAVAFGGTPAAAFTVASSTSLTATVGSGDTGTISVTTPGGMVTSSSTFTVIPPAPTITSFTPTVGAGGQVVTLTGTNFTGATAVTFNSSAAAFTVISATTIAATAPSGVSTGPLIVTTPGGTATNAANFTVNSISSNPVDHAAMVWVPGGSFTMGTTYGYVWWEAPYTQQVTLTGYWIYANEVTVAQYLAFCAATGYAQPPWPGDQYSWAGKSGWNDPTLQQQPIVDVSWYDAQTYAAWAGVSLPTEAQYEYAARGPQENNYPWGGTATTANPYNDWDITRSANWYNSMGQHISTWPVGSFPADASWCGAQDLAGNVWEWCADYYGNYSPTPVTNPTGPATGGCRVLRGGAWDDGNAPDFRGAYRDGNCYSNFWNNDIGFRCVSLSAPISTAITSFTPSSGGTGTVVTITGANFTGATAVVIGGTQAATFTVDSAFSITATVAGGATGTISVTTPGGTASSTGSFTYIANPIPMITSFSPSSGSTGKVATITGANFIGTSAVAFGGTAAASFTVINAATISATIGSGTTGTVSVTTPGGTATSSGVFTFTAVAGPGDWWMFHHDLQHSGRSLFSGPASPVLQWTYPTGAIFCSSPTLGADGTIYIGSWNGNLYAINPNGTQKWAFPTEEYIWSSPTLGTDGTIYVGSNDENLYAVNPDGTLQWAFPTGGPIFASPTLGADGTIYVGSCDHNLYAIDPDGTPRWAFPTGDRIYSSAALGADGTIYVGSNDNKLYAVNPDGSQQWAFPTGDYLGSSPALGADGIIYVGSNDHNLYAVYPNGTLQWAFSTGDQLTSSPALGTDGTIYVGSCDDKLYAVNPDGKQKWAFPTGALIYGSSPAVGADGTIYIGSNDAHLYAINPNGTRLWAYATGAPILSSPALGANGAIYVGSEDNNLYAIGGPPRFAPTVTSFSPSSGGNGTTVTITGTSLTGATAVAFGGIPAATFTINSDAQITAGVGSGATGNITVTTPGGTATSGGVFTCVMPLTGITLSSTPPAPGTSGTPVHLLATAIGGTNVQFQFWIYNPAANPAWSQLQGYSSSAGCTWTPATAGSYLFSVTALDAAGAAENIMRWYTVTGTPPLTAVSVAAAPASPQPVNTPITFTASTTGGTDVQYQFWLYNPAAAPAWSMLQGYSTQTACAWTPTTAGQYLLSVTAQDATGAAVNTMLWYTVGTPLTAVSVTAAPASPQPVDTPITFTAVATGGTDVQYQYWVYNANANPAWSQLQTYSSQATYTWTPTLAGSYFLSVTAQDGVTGAAVNTTFWYTITGGSPLTAVNVTTSPVSPQAPNTPITLTATATGGTDVQYQFWVYNANANPAWSQLQGYSSQSTYTWTPTLAGSYFLSVTAQDGVTGAAVNTTFWYTISGGSPLTAVNVTVSPASPQAPNTPITLSATATGGTNVQYQFWVYNANANPAWSQLQGYSSQSTYTWTPTTAGNYFLSVTAQDGTTGTVVNTTFWYTVD